MLVHYHQNGYGRRNLALKDHSRSAFLFCISLLPPPTCHRVAFVASARSCLLWPLRRAGVLGLCVFCRRNDSAADSTNRRRPRNPAARAGLSSRRRSVTGDRDGDRTFDTLGHQLETAGSHVAKVHGEPAMIKLSRRRSIAMQSQIVLCHDTQLSTSRQRSADGFTTRLRGGQGRDLFLADVLHAGQSGSGGPPIVILG